ncbi:MAG: NAD(P)-dependent oxidoreductase [Prevotellaceae bacterium]|jgi:nucleoside-diphosphate-sugar epimerase|nr:NAD(P)-dependent oxidoreductase [Prevotellaceae bacterium]
MRILITGASGFIGSFLVEKALEKGFETYAGIRKSSSKQYLQDERIHFIDLNYSDPCLLTRQLRDFKCDHGKFDYIVHNAGVTKTTKKIDFDRINFEFTKNFVDALIDADMVPQKFVYMSSLSAWGPGDEKTLAPIMLSDKPHPNTAYGISKLKSEKYIEAQRGFPFIFARPTGVYGPREKDYFVFNQTVKRGIEPSMGFKPQYLTFIYVRDLVQFVFTAIESPVMQRGYFITDGHVYTNKEYADIVKRHLHKKRTIKIKVPLFLVKAIAATLDTVVCGWFGKSPTLNRDKYNILSAMNWICEIEPLRSDFNFKADYDLNRGMKESIDWYKQEGWL